MTTTAQLRKLWSPVCKGPFVKIEFHGEGVASVKASAAPAFRALNAVFVAHDYQTRKEDTGGYNCRQITGGTGYSLHAYGIAVDVNWKTNPYGSRVVTDMPDAMIKDIEALRTNSGHVVFRWGGRYSGNKDCMHFEIVCTPSQLATGIKNVPVVPAPDQPLGNEENDDMLTGFDKSPEDVARAYIREKCDQHWGYGKMLVKDQDWLLAVWRERGREGMMIQLLDHPKAAKGPGV